MFKNDKHGRKATSLYLSQLIPSPTSNICARRRTHLYEHTDDAVYRLAAADVISIRVREAFVEFRRGFIRLPCGIYVGGLGGVSIFFKLNSCR